MNTVCVQCPQCRGWDHIPVRVTYLNNSDESRSLQVSGVLLQHACGGSEDTG